MESATIPIGSVHLLHVDDDPSFAELTAEFLKNEYEQISVDTVTGPKEAIRRLDNDEYDCIISDYDMPTQTGIEFLKTVRKEYPDLPFILFTGKGSEEVASQAISQGVTDYLQKGRGADQYTVLANRVLNAVQRRTAEQQLQSQIEHMSEGFCALDGDWRIQYVNDRAEQIFQQDREELLGEGLWDLLPDLRGTTIESQFRDAIETGDSRRFEYYVPSLQTTFEIHAYSAATGLSVYFNDINHKKAREALHEELEWYRKEIYQTVSQTDVPTGTRIEQILELGRNALNVENGHLVAIDQAADSHEVRWAVGSDLVTTGTVSDLSETFCRHAIDVDGVLDLFNTKDTKYNTDIADQTWDIKCYIGAKVQINGKLFGTVCFVDQQRRQEPISGPEQTLVELIARVLSQLLERQLAHEERNRIFDRMTDAIFSVSSDWRVTTANTAAREVLCEMQTGSDPKIVGQRLQAVLPVDEMATTYEQFEAAMADQAERTFEAYCESADRWFDIRAYPSDSGLSIYFRDITDKRQRNAEIRAREETLREIYDIISDADRSFEAQVEALLALGQRVIGAEYGSLARIRGNEYTFEVVAAPEGTIEAGDTFDISATNCERTIVTEETITMADIATDEPAYADRPPHAEFGVDCYVGTPILVDGDVYGTFCFYGTESRSEPFSEWEVTFVDLLGKWISRELDRQRVEDQLNRQNEQLNQVASAVTHDLRNPLSVAKGRLELAKQEAPSQHHDEIEIALDRIDELSEGLLLLARGEDVIELEEINLATVARQSWRCTATDEAVLHITTESTVVADQRQFQRLLENVLGNAIKHGGTDITVTIGELQDRSGFYIEDDGPGVGLSDSNRILESGFSTSEDGTGLGLAIVNRIVSAHDWEMAITDGEADGARFEFSGVQMTSSSE
jgi:PAS domain S-box-containing protein